MVNALVQLDQWIRWSGGLDRCLEKPHSASERKIGHNKDKSMPAA